MQCHVRGISFYIPPTRGLHNTGVDPDRDYGPLRRAVYEMGPDVLVHQTVIPGGQNGSPDSEHYQDEMALWVRNEAHPIHATEADLLPDIEWSVELTP